MSLKPTAIEPVPTTAQVARAAFRRQLDAKRAGLEGPLSQGVRVFGLRRSRAIGLANTPVQQVASAAALNLDR
jgi:Transposase DDE domain